VGFTPSLRYDQRFVLPFEDNDLFRPYLIRDFANHVISTLKGGSSRGGYSAV